jgi:hypothetical protein
MAITKTSIFKTVGKRLGPLAAKVTGIDDELLDTLNDLGSRASFLVATATETTADGVPYVDAPDDCRHILLAVIDEGNFLESGSMEEYEKSIEGVETPTEGEPYKYHQFGDLVYLYDPIPDGEYTVRFHFLKRSSSVSVISLADRFLEALVWGVMFRLCLGVLQPDPFKPDSVVFQKIITDRAMIYEQQYEKQITLLGRDTPVEPIRIKYCEP